MGSVGEVIVITGANSGVGLAVAKKLSKDAASRSQPLILCLACRNVQRAKEAKSEILEASGNPALLSVEVVQIDTSKLSSVAAAAKELSERYKEIQCLVLNAGILPVSGFSPSALLKKRTLEGGSAYLKQHDEFTSDGLRSVFCTNLFGHYCLVHLLRSRIRQQSQPCHVIWCSSRSASASSFSITDIQHHRGFDPYSSSKYAMDMVSVAINETLQEDGIFSDVACPGLVMSALTWQILPRFVWQLLLILLYMLSFFFPLFTLSAAEGATSLVWLCQQRPKELNHRVKYLSNGHPFKHSTVSQRKITISTQDAMELDTKLQQLMEEYKDKLVA